MATRAALDRGTERIATSGLTPTVRQDAVRAVKYAYRFFVADDVLSIHSMTIEKLRELYTAQPFRPFVIHLADGRAIPVVHREFIMAAPSGRTIVVMQPDDSMNIIDLLLVTDLELTPVKNGTGKKRRG